RHAIRHLVVRLHRQVGVGDRRRALIGDKGHPFAHVRAVDTRLNRGDPRRGVGHVKPRFPTGVGDHRL
ncbi:hypothetical protein IR150_18510, partial [Providencia alcalifaciens]|uniref:hypothetical protein n=1 Tax=Providencia alcalifaciens TaxID=126385 RepID=UPI0015D0CF36